MADTVDIPTPKIDGIPSYNISPSSTNYDFATSTIGTLSDTSTVVLANVASNVKVRLPMIVASSLSLIAGLAWNSFFNSIINYYVPEEYRKTYSAWIKVIYAFILTAIIIIVISIILYYMPSDKVKSVK